MTGSSDRQQLQCHVRPYDRQPYHLRDGDQLAATPSASLPPIIPRPENPRDIDQEMNLFEPQ